MFENLEVVQKALVSLGIGFVAAVAFAAGFGVTWLLLIQRDARRLRYRREEQERRRRVEQDDETREYAEGERP